MWWKEVEAEGKSVSGEILAWIIFCFSEVLEKLMMAILSKICPA